MPDFRRPRHRAVARLLKALNAEFLRANGCYFGGGTRIALELDEFRESQDVDFLCAQIDGYRAMRARIADRSLGPLLARLPRGMELLRDVRADQYGIRTVVGVDGEPVKFEIILEARVALGAIAVRNIPVACLDRPSCFAEKWLANADRWSDTAVMSRDAIDLAFMLSAWGDEEAAAGAVMAQRAYGLAVRDAARRAATKLLEDARYRNRCAEALAVEDTKTLRAGLAKLARFAKSMSEAAR